MIRERKGDKRSLLLFEKKVTEEKKKKKKKRSARPLHTPCTLHLEKLVFFKRHLPSLKLDYLVPLTRPACA